jgi:hypothetical protein
MLARKAHRCIWCGRAVLAVERYRYALLIRDGRPEDQRWHGECDQAFEALHANAEAVCAV